MAEALEGEHDFWDVSRTSRATLDDYWEHLCKPLETDWGCKEFEIKYFIHCTSLTGKHSIEERRCLFGGPTDLPERAPLSSYRGMKGVWLAPAGVDLPTKSPYGTQRMVFKVRDIVRYVSKPLEDEHNLDSDDQWDAPEPEVEPEQTKKGGHGKAAKKKDRKKKHREVKRTQKECFLKHKLPEKKTQELPLLFFECAHHYGTNQYVRLILIRPNDPKVEWCREACKELDFGDNPFLEYRGGRMWKYRTVSRKRDDVIAEILLAGDIVFDKLGESPDWDVVGKLQRAGFDPTLGVVCDA